MYNSLITGQDQFRLELTVALTVLLLPVVLLLLAFLLN